MPKKPKRPCSHPGCPKLTDGRFCEEHAKQYDHEYNRYRRDPESAKRYGTTWRKIRNRYVAAHPLCEMCKREGRLTPAQEVHHVSPLSEKGTHDESNLMALCKSCHLGITLSENNKRRE
jgi:5-methylcytosine-specific restriction protein A